MRCQIAVCSLRIMLRAFRVRNIIVTASRNTKRWTAVAERIKPTTIHQGTHLWEEELRETANKKHLNHMRYTKAILWGFLSNSRSLASSSLAAAFKASKFLSSPSTSMATPNWNPQTVGLGKIWGCDGLYRTKGPTSMLKVQCS